jgi:hypothetical protein
MSDCCLPNLGCLSIPVVSTNVAGIPGTNGISPTITVGTVTTGAPGDPVTVTNVGTENAAIFDFEIPAGAAGANGAPGADGASLLFSTEGINRTTAGWGTLLGYGPSLPANTLANVGDRVVFEAGINHYYQYTGTSTKITYADVRLLLNGASVTLSVYPVAIENSLPASFNEISSARFTVSLRKAAATRCQVGVTFIDTYGNAVAYNPVDVTIDFTSAITVGLQGNIPVISGGSYVSCEDFSATLYSL